MKKVFLLTIVVFLLLGQVAYCEQWNVLGARAIGMGGAFVGMAKGPLAQYWNPAGLNQKDNISGVNIGAGAGVEFTGDILKSVDDIGKLANDYTALQTDQKTGGFSGAKEISAFVKTLSTLEKINGTGQGVLGELNASVNVKVWKIGVSVINYSAVGATPYIDVKNIGLGAESGNIGVKIGSTLTDVATPSSDYLTARDNLKSAIDTLDFNNLQTLLCGSSGCGGSITNSTNLANSLVNQSVKSGVSAQDLNTATANLSDYAPTAAPIVSAAAGGSYSNNQSSLTFKLASFSEITAGYAHDDLFTKGFSLGGNVKLIQGIIGQKKFEFLKMTGSNEQLSSDWSNYYKQSAQPGLDLGVLMDFDKTFPDVPWNLRAGIVARNINRPGFDSPDGSKYYLDPQMRFGVAFNPLNWNFLNVAFDIDITNNKTAIDNFKSRQIAFGTEFNLINKAYFNLPLRVGLTKNISESTSDMVYTAGLGINLLRLNVDLGVAINPVSVKVTDTAAIPEAIKGSLSIGYLW